MDFFTILTILTVLAAIFGFINEKYLHLPDTIGIMGIAILFTLVITIIGSAYPGYPEAIEKMIRQIDFGSLLLDVMLCFLLFAGALHTNFEQLKVQRYPILVFATIGVLCSTFLVGTICWYILNAIGFDVSYILCLLFGALISPTDPIAVLGILKKAGVPKKLEIKIVGESLFNDGVGVVIFLTIFHIAESGNTHFSFYDVGLLFIQEVLGGILIGAAAGWIAYRLMKAIDSWAIEVLITLAIVMGVYSLCAAWHLSGPLAVVAAGLFVGNDTVRAGAMSEITESYVDRFWELVDVYLNAILFVLIGLEIIVLTFTKQYLIAGLIIIPVVLLSRYLSLAGPIYFFKKKLKFVPNTNLVMTWGGLRGGISIALALSLTTDMNRELFIAITYIIVIFSIVVQGLTVETLVRYLNKRNELGTG